MLIQVNLEELKQLIKEAVNDALKVSQPSASKTKTDDLIKIADVEEILGVSKVTIHKWKKIGRIPFHRISNRIFFKREEILDSLKKISRNKLCTK